MADQIATGVQWVVDDSTGAITGYRRKIAGVDTAFSLDADAIQSSVSRDTVKRRVVANLGWLPGGLVERSTPPAVAYDTRVRHVIMTACTQLSLVYQNMKQVVNIGERDGDNPITVKASLEVGTTTIPLTFGGASTVTLTPGGIAETDPIAYAVPPGTVVYARTRVTCGAGGYIPIGRYVVSGLGEGLVIDGSDQSAATGALVGGVAGYVYGPSMVVGDAYSANRVKAIVIFGDSISVGASDATSGANGARGFLERALVGAVPHVTSGCSGGSLLNYVTRHWRAWGAVLTYVDYAILESGVNDIKNGRTLLQMQDNAFALWSELAAAGVIPTHTTTTPINTTASSGVATPEYEAVRVPWNDWLRDGAPYTVGGQIVRVGSSVHPLRYVHEIADLGETGRNSGSWRSGYSSDGTHISGAGSAALAPGINTSVFV